MPNAPKTQQSIWEPALRDVRGIEYWRSVLETCRPSAGGEHASLGRRELFQLFGASLALAGLSGCVQRPREQILPYVRTPQAGVPGVALEYATSMTMDGFAVGLLVRSHEGRPTKIEGNPSHPASLGASGIFEQASVLSLYDPSRLRGPSLHGVPTTWESALGGLRGARSWRPWFVLPPQSSPSTLDWIRRIGERYPAARFCYATPLSRRAAYRASGALFGRPLEPQYDFAASGVVLSLGADFLSRGPMSLRWARDFSARHRPPIAAGEMSRLYQLEASPSPTGSVADHRLAVRSEEIPFLAAALLGEVAASADRGLVPGLAAWGTLPRPEQTPHADWLRALARDLVRARGTSLVIAGDEQPAETHVLALALNGLLGNLGHTLQLTAPVLQDPLGSDSLEALVEAIRAGGVDAVVICDGNPAYTAPPELELARWLEKVPHSAHLTYQANETSRLCSWTLPLAHYLESWGDARAYDGTLSYVQPLIQPIYPARSLLEVLASIGSDAAPEGRILLREHWQAELGGSFEREWPERLRQGFAVGSAFGRVDVAADGARASALVQPALTPPQLAGLELNLRPSTALHDGRFANNAWLLELPDPITKQSWGNALEIGSADATRLGVETGRIVELVTPLERVAVPVVVVPGQAEGALGLSFGYGRQATGELSDGVGVSAYRLRPRDGGFRAQVDLHVTERREELALAAPPQSQRGRDLTFASSLRAYREQPAMTARAKGPQPSLLPVYQQPHTGPAAGVQWAMTIDTTICTGCSACVIACQAENNVPVVGKEEVRRSREMHWLRIDTFLEPGPEGERRVQQPMLCQHCESAPCEYVCPVNATVHSPDGLNEMVYNRCIGTRFCSNNCPYKVRRFNWFEYNDLDPLTALQRNPEVTVRQRGVMEKCTYCVQRIRGAESRARVEQRELRPDEVVTACQEACPTRAIQFGSLSHEHTKMVEWRREPRVFSVLHDLGTRPRTQYLAKISNENPELERR